MVNNNPDRYEQFDETQGSVANTFTSKVTGHYGFTLLDDPRFQNAEPNRGLTGPPIYHPEQKLFKFKDEDALEVFHETTDVNWFCPENIQMLPLIKL